MTHFNVTFANDVTFKGTMPTDPRKFNELIEAIAWAVYDFGFPVVMDVPPTMEAGIYIMTSSVFS